ncbi:MAG: hypothetical protein IKY42_10865 [Bacteroidaceae bacterium]|nr:hypothetical protein [Bacteroidaceae bacterium]
MTEEWERAEKQKKLREQWEGVNSFIKMLFKELEEKDKQIEELKKTNSETLVELNHINGDLIIEVAEKDKQIEELKKELEHRHEVELALHEMNKKRLDLEAQIEKMKCCSNCTHNYDDCEMLPCRNKNHWKLKE